MSTLPPASVFAAAAQRPMANRAFFGSAQSATYPKPLSTMSRVMLKVPSRAPAGSLSVLYSNVIGLSVNSGSYYQETDGPSSITLKASLEISATPTSAPFAPAAGNILIPLFCKGSRTVVLEPGGDVEFDPVQCSLAAGQVVYVRTWYSLPTGGGMGPSKVANSVNYEAANNGLFNVAVGTSATAATQITGTLAGGPFLPSGVALFGTGLTGTLYCNSDGTFTAGNGIASGSSINLTTGAYTINLTTATAPNAIYWYGFGNYGAAGADETMVPVPTDLTYIPQSMFGPSAVFGVVAASVKTRPFGTLGVGDSITAGAGNQQTGEFLLSYLDYGINGAAGLVKLAQSGETAAAFVQTNYRRLRLSRGRFDRVFWAYGTNDLAIGQTLAQLQASTLAGWAMLAAMLPNGFRDIWACTILPRCISVANNTPFTAAFLVARNQFNAWLYTQVGKTCGGVVDHCPAVEATPGSQAGSGSGTWTASALTYDGTHPSYAGHKAMAALCGVGGSAQSPAFQFPA